MILNWLRRATRFAIVRIVVALACVVLPGATLYAVLRLLPLSRPVTSTFFTLGATVLGVLGYVFYVRGLEKRPVVEFGRAGALRELALGAVLGSALFTASVASLALAGSFHLRSYGSWSALAGPLAGALMAGVLEEIVFRGIVFRIVEQSVGTWLALGVSALLFGAAHVTSPNWTVLDLAAIMLEAGILLAGAFTLTRRLWLPIGLHIAWNFTEGGIFGLAVSGAATQGLLRGDVAGPVWLTGGSYGVEGSAVAVGWCLLAALALFALAVRKGRIVAPSWRRSAADAA
jgi:membrane protease YdiL (CAAX protease family)